MWPDRVSNPGPLAHESDALPTALRGPASDVCIACPTPYVKLRLIHVETLMTVETCVHCPVKSLLKDRHICSAAYAFSDSLNHWAQHGTK